METKEYTRPTITSLEKLRGNDLFISGKCLIPNGRFSQYFLSIEQLGKHDKPFLKPIFVLQPEKSQEKFILLPWCDDIESLRRNVGTNPFSVFLHNTHSIMYIVKISDLTKKEISEIEGLQFEEDWLNNTCGETFHNLKQKIQELGLMQSTVVRVDFTAFFKNKEDSIGEFRLLFEPRESHRTILRSWENGIQNGN